jgi:hypothetical protein
MLFPFWLTEMTWGHGVRVTGSRAIVHNLSPDAVALQDCTGEGLECIKGRVLGIWAKEEGQEQVPGDGLDFGHMNRKYDTQPSNSMYRKERNQLL